MAKNVEIKTTVPDFATLKKRIEETFQITSETIIQEDRFFHCTFGRLKLRFFADHSAELIHYSREDKAELRTSDYHRFAVDNPDQLDTLLRNSLGLIGIVKKNRLLYLIGQTRIHLDRVEDLGNFLELEVLLKDGQDMQQGLQIATEILQQLEIKKETFCSQAYIDLVLEKNQ